MSSKSERVITDGIDPTSSQSVQDSSTQIPEVPVEGLATDYIEYYNNNKQYINSENFKTALKTIIEKLNGAYITYNDIPITVYFSIPNSLFSKLNKQASYYLKLRVLQFSPTEIDTYIDVNGNENIQRIIALFSAEEIKYMTLENILYMPTPVFECFTDAQKDGLKTVIENANQHYVASLDKNKVNTNIITTLDDAGVFTLQYNRSRGCISGGRKPKNQKIKKTSQNQEIKKTSQNQEIKKTSQTQEIRISYTTRIPPDTPNLYFHTPAIGDFRQPFVIFHENNPTP